ncbi:hypothetical protein CC80DRAFT_501220 [Byssothecium circinans]|uniref:Uncharacterized protein n=1 Tax=Byssothecium circinans TaxID=147558 RepID=A0A6A5UDI5_9PLEO|nr:hypothetical protein CC80DRAFT_501220 [Byssothecium circinans]
MGMMTIHKADDFRGYSPSLVKCLALLKGIPDASEIEQLRLKYGCTCGRCVGGFLSPRMHLSLRRESASCSDYLEDFLGVGPEFFLNPPIPGGVGSQHVPNSIKRQMMGDISLCLGYRDLLLTFMKLSEEEVVPNATNFLARAELASSGRQCNGIEEEEEEDGERDALPECRNDLEYGFVSRMCGYETVSLVGTNFGAESLFDY